MIALKLVGRRATRIKNFKMTIFYYVQYNYGEDFGYNNLLSELNFFKFLLTWFRDPEPV